MKKLLIIFALLPAIAAADPSISGDAGRSTGNSHSDTMKNDKSLSADKSRGHRHADSDSRERVKEQSLSKSHSEKIGSSAEKSRSYSSEININGLLLREFTSRYERNYQGNGAAGEYFAACQTMLKALPNYPTYNVNNGGVEGRDTVERAISYGGNVPPQANAREPYLSRYVQCRITASYWLSEAGDRTTSQSVTTENEVQQKIRDTFSEMDSEPELFQTIRQKSRETWMNADCGGSQIEDFKHFKSPSLRYGVFSFEGSEIEVDYRKTLSEASINGRSYKIAVNASESQSVGMDDSISKDARVSRSERAGDSNERYTESKKTASLSKSKSIDKSNSSKVDRSSGNSMNATPSK